MRTLLIIGALFVVATVACGGGDDGADIEALLEELGDVCVESPDVAGGDIIQVDSPDPGDRIQSPLVATGKIAAFGEGRFWITVVEADGEHVIDYPGETGVAEVDGEPQLAPFEVSAPFYREEETPACLWVYRRLVEDPEDAVKIPVILVPSETEAPSE